MKETYTNCPHCNQMLVIAPAQRKVRDPMPKLTRNGWTYEPTDQMEMSYPAAIEPAALPAPGGRYTKRTPTRAPSREADIIVPMWRAVIGGTLGNTLLWMIIYGGLNYYSVWGILASWLTCIGLGWLASTRAFDKLMVIVEEMEEAITKSNDQAKPEPQRVELVLTRPDRRGNNHYFFPDVPDTITPDKFLEWAIGVTDGVHTLAEGEWTGKGKLFSKSEYKGLVGGLQTGGLIQWVDDNAHAQGRRLTDEGRAALLSYIEAQDAN